MDVSSREFKDGFSKGEFVSHVDGTLSFGVYSIDG